MRALVISAGVIIMGIAVLTLMSFTTPAFADHPIDYICRHIDNNTNFGFMLCPQTPQVDDIIRVRGNNFPFPDCFYTVDAIFPDTDRKGSVFLGHNIPEHICGRFIDFPMDYIVTGKPSG